MKNKRAKHKSKHKIRFKFFMEQEDNLTIEVFIKIFSLFILVFIYANQKKNITYSNPIKKNCPDILKEITSFDENI